MDYIKFVKKLAADIGKLPISQKNVFNRYMSMYGICLEKEDGFLHLDGVQCQGYANPMERAIHVCAVDSTDVMWRILWHEAAHTTGWFVNGREMFDGAEEEMVAQLTALTMTLIFKSVITPDSVAHMQLYEQEYNRAYDSRIMIAVRRAVEMILSCSQP